MKTETFYLQTTGIDIELSPFPSHNTSIPLEFLRTQICACCQWHHQEYCGLGRLHIVTYTNNTPAGWENCIIIAHTTHPPTA